MKKENTTPTIHIGSIIRAKAAERGISETKLAQLILRDHSTVSDIFRRKNIHSEQLLQISIALEYDFFKEYSKILNFTVQKEQNIGVVTIVISDEKITIKQENGITEIVDYQKIHTK